MSNVLIIAATPRSGSYLFQDLVNSTGALGICREFAPRADHEHWNSILGFKQYSDYLANFVPLHTTPNGITAFKAMWFQFVEFRRTVASDRRSQFFSCWRNITKERPPIFVWLRRCDRIAQTVSWILARQSSIWSSNQLPSNWSERYDELTEKISDNILLEAWRFINSENDGWAHFFAGQQRQVCLFYEEWACQPREAIEMLCKITGVRPLNSPVFDLPRKRLPSHSLQQALGNRLLNLVR